MIMIEEPALPDSIGIDALVLQALVRKLLEKGLLSQDDVLSLLYDAVKRFAASEKASRAVSGTADSSTGPGHPAGACEGPTGKG